MNWRAQHWYPLDGSVVLFYFYYTIKRNVIFFLLVLSWITLKYSFIISNYSWEIYEKHSWDVEVNSREEDVEWERMAEKKEQNLSKNSDELADCELSSSERTALPIFRITTWIELLLTVIASIGCFIMFSVFKKEGIFFLAISAAILFFRLILLGKYDNYIFTNKE